MLKYAVKPQLRNFHKSESHLSSMQTSPRRDLASISPLNNNFSPDEKDRSPSVLPDPANTDFNNNDIGHVDGTKSSGIPCRGAMKPSLLTRPSSKSVQNIPSVTEIEWDPKVLKVRFFRVFRDQSS